MTPLDGFIKQYFGLLSEAEEYSAGYPTAYTVLLRFLKTVVAAAGEVVVTDAAVVVVVNDTVVVVNDVASVVVTAEDREVNESERSAEETEVSVPDETGVLIVAETEEELSFVSGTVSVRDSLFAHDESIAAEQISTSRNLKLITLYLPS